jgi:hypothetical protein
LKFERVTLNAIVICPSEFLKFERVTLNAIVIYPFELLIVIVDNSIFIFLVAFIFSCFSKKIIFVL